MCLPRQILLIVFRRLIYFVLIICFHCHYIAERDNNILNIYLLFWSHENHCRIKYRNIREIRKYVFFFFYLKVFLIKKIVALASFIYFVYDKIWFQILTVELITYVSSNFFTIAIIGFRKPVTLLFIYLFIFWWQ